jgi:hypothetical protein
MTGTRRVRESAEVILLLYPGRGAASVAFNSVALMIASLRVKIS